MKIGELKNYDDDAELMVVAGNRIQPVLAGSRSNDGKYLLLVGDRHPQPRTHYSKEDVGFIIRPMSYGFSDEVIARSIRKTANSLRKKMKSLEIGRTSPDKEPG